MQSDMLDEVHDLNYGGCGYFSLMFYNAIKDIYPEAKIVAFDSYETLEYYKDNINNVINNGHNGYLHDMAPSHLLVKIGKYYIDGYEYFTDTSDVPHQPGKRWTYIGEYSDHELEVALMYGNWNSDYDKSQNKEVLRIIDKYLSPNLPLRKSIIEKIGIKIRKIYKSNKAILDREY